MALVNELKVKLIVGIVVNVMLNPLAAFGTGLIRTLLDVVDLDGSNSVLLVGVWDAESSSSYEQ
jgi:hypothetical protein